MPYLYYESYISVVLKPNYKPVHLFNKHDKKLPGETDKESRKKMRRDGDDPM